MDFQVKSAPGINIGDMIVVVSASTGEVLSITDVTTGVAFTYQPSPPFKSTRMRLPVLGMVMFWVFMLPAVGWYMYVLQIYATSAAAFIVMFLIFRFLSWHRRVQNHNVKLAEQVAAMALNASADPAIW
jgi:hypothetical protein